MKKIRKNIKTISIALSATFLFFSCSQYDDAADIAKNQNPNYGKAQKYSGEDIFKGLFFFQNDIAENIPEINKIKENLMQLDKNVDFDLNKKLMEFSDFSIEFINKKYPNFFDDLEKTMYSQNFYDIEKMMDLSVLMIEQSGLASEIFSKEFLIGENIKNDDVLMGEILNLDLSNPSDVEKLKRLLNESNNALDGVGNQNRAFLVVIAVALAYLVVGAVSFVVAAYSVAVKVAYWDNYLNRNYNDKQLSREMVISNIDQFFQNKGYNEITN